MKNDPHKRAVELIRCMIPDYDGIMHRIRILRALSRRSIDPDTEVTLRHFGSAFEGHIYALIEAFQLLLVKCEQLRDIIPKVDYDGTIHSKSTRRGRSDGSKPSRKRRQ